MKILYCGKTRLTAIIFIFIFLPFNYDNASTFDEPEQFASGGSHNLWIKADGTLWAWGYNYYGQLGDSTNTDRKSPVQIGSDNKWTAAAAGIAHSAGLKSDGTLWAWGLNTSGQLGYGTTDIGRRFPVQVGTDNKWISVADGGYHTMCLKSDGTLWGWGYNSNGQLGDSTNDNRNVPVQVGTDNKWVSISAGQRHTIGLKSDGTLWAWGYNLYGQLGNGENGDSTDQNIPVRIGADNNWTAISCGFYHNIGLRSNGTIWAWGSNDYGELGDSTNLYSNIPVQAGSDNNWIKISAGGSSGGSHSAGLRSDGTLWAWGYNYYGELGDNTYTDSNVPVRIGTDNNWVSVSTGGYHITGLKSDGTLWGNGYNNYGQLGDGTKNNSNFPIQSGTDTDNKWTKIAAGKYYTAGMKSNGILWTWGRNDHGQLGDSTNTDRNVPVQAGGNNSWTAITGGSFHMMGLRTDGTLWGWGLNVNGQLGDSTNTDRNFPVQAGSNNNWIAIAGGGSHTMGLRTDGTLWGWGLNNKGQLGDSTNTDRNIPVRVGSDNKWRVVAAGLDHSAGIKTDGTLWAWGNNTFGQLGDSTNTDTNIPSQIGTDNNWIIISAGENHTSGLKADGTLWAWGYNFYGQLGDSTNTDTNIPVRIGEDNKWTRISGGGSHTISLKSDGTLWTWGNNVSGQLGDGTTDNGNVPVQIGGDNKWVAISCGFEHNAALKSNGVLLAWGNNEYGQLGDGTFDNSSAPELVLGRISASAGSGGTISPSGSISVNYGDDQTFNISSDTGYYIDDVLVDSVSAGIESTYTFNNVTRDHTITVNFTLNQYRITASAGSGGSITPSGSMSAGYGENKTFNIAADSGYHIQDVLVDSVTVGAVSTYTFNNVMEDHSISAGFAINTFTITASAGNGGNISPAGIIFANYGNSQVFNISWDTGRQIENVLVDSVSVGAVSTYAFNNITGNHTISVTYMDAVTYSISASAGPGGSIIPSNNIAVYHGSDQSFNIFTDTGYHIIDVLADSVSVGAVSEYTFSNVTANHEINASFDINTYTINALAGNGGGISPSGGVQVDYGTNRLFNISADAGYHIKDVLADSVSVGAVSAYTFNNVTEAHLISASFAINSYTITASAGSGGSISPPGIVMADHGSSRTYDITADPDYYIADVSVNNVSAGAVSTYKFDNISGNNVISAAFSAKQIPTTPAGNIDTVSPGSINRIDGHDLYLLSIAFGSQPGGLNWNSAANLDGNSIIDGDDLILLAANFGKKN